MNQVAMITLLNSLEDLPSFYDHAPVKTELPFLAIHCDQPDNFKADNGVYVEKWGFRIDLYTVEKDLANEAKIKKLLNDNDIAWDKTEQYLDDQACWEVEFTFDVLGNEDPAPEPEPKPTPEPDGGEDDGNP